MQVIKFVIDEKACQIKLTRTYANDNDKPE